MQRCFSHFIFKISDWPSTIYVEGKRQVWYHVGSFFFLLPFALGCFVIIITHSGWPQGTLSGQDLGRAAPVDWERPDPGISSVSAEKSGRGGLVAQSCPTRCDPMDDSPPGSSVHESLQARILEWVAISFFRGSSWPRDRTRITCTAGRFFTNWATSTVKALLWETVWHSPPVNGYRKEMYHVLWDKWPF